MKFGKRKRKSLVTLVALFLQTSVVPFDELNYAVILEWRVVHLACEKGVEEDVLVAVSVVVAPRLSRPSTAPSCERFPYHVRHAVFV